MRSKIFSESGFPVREKRFDGFTDAAPGRMSGPGVSSILSNGTRASILHLMAGSPETLYSMQVEELASAIGTRPRLVIYHLEKLKSAGLVEVKKTRKYGQKERRSIWGLDMRNGEQVRECCARLGHPLGKKS